MTKSSGSRVKCMTCGNLYNQGKKKTNSACPYCIGDKPMPEVASNKRRREKRHK